MSLRTHSKFYYGFEVSDDALYLDFDEGGGELSAELEIGSYTMEEFADEMARALNDAGALDYTVSVNRTTRVFTISASGNVSLLLTSGGHAGTSAFGLAGFTGADRASAASHVGNAAAGAEYTTQFIAQSHVAPEHNQAATYGTVNKSAGGDVEVIRYGTERFLEMNLKFITNTNHGASAPIRYNASGVEDAEALLEYLVGMGPLEFMEDENDPATFINVRLESTPDDSKGLKFKLKELYSQNLPGHFETGVLKFRVLE